MCEEARDFLSVGPLSYKIPLKLFVENRRRLIEGLRCALREEAKNAGVWVLMMGGRDDDFSRYDTDVQNGTFRQESYFQWLFGVEEPDFWGAIEITSGRVVLLAPKLPDSFAIWAGRIWEAQQFSNKYGLETVFYQFESIADILKGFGVKKLLVNYGGNTDSGSTTAEVKFDGIDSFVIDKSILFRVMSCLRVQKTEMEIDVMRYATKVSCDAHVAVMQSIKPGWTEYQAEATFLKHIYFHGAMRHVCYTCICASSQHASVLHYGHAGAPNDRQIEDGDMCLFDMGGEYACYCSDVTCSFPVNGKFTQKQAAIYNMVLKANREVIAKAKPGVWWTELHLHAQRVILHGLKEIGVLKGSVDDMMAENVGYYFMPLVWRRIPEPSTRTKVFIGLLLHPLRTPPQRRRKPINNLVRVVDPSGIRSLEDIWIPPPLHMLLLVMEWVI